MLQDAHDAQRKTNYAACNRRHSWREFQFAAQNHHRRSQQGCGCVHFSAQDTRDLRQQNVTSHPSAHGCDGSHLDRNEGMNSVSKRFLGSGDGK